MVKLKNVRVHNLQSVSLDLPVNKLICFTGVSGSGKSSLAFDTIHVEGQRRYVESLSTQAKHLIGQMKKPDLESIENLSPTIAIEQKTSSKNPRSTVGTMTEIYDFLRILFARLGTAYCPVSNEVVQARGQNEIISEIEELFQGKTVIILAPYIKSKKGSLHDDLEEVRKKGYTRVRIDGEIQRLTDSIELEKSVSHSLDIVIDCITVKEETHSRLLESVETALEESNGTLLILNKEEEKLYSTRSFSPMSGLSYEPLDPQDFSFNSPKGMCETCQGVGTTHTYVLDKIIDENKSISEDCCSIASSYTTVRYKNIYDNLAALYDFPLDVPWKKLPERAKKLFLYGSKKKWIRMVFIHPVSGARWVDFIQWKGVLHESLHKYQKAKSKSYKKRHEDLMDIASCPDCNGGGLKPYPSAARFKEKRISDLVALPIDELCSFFSKTTLTSYEKKVGGELIEEITKRLRFLVEVGLEYVSLSRKAPSLSGGEAQRVRLASQIGSGLSEVTYILDEPSIGLHPQDNKKLIQALVHLKENNNSVIVVEHDAETILAADHIVDFGPKAGHKGGEVVFNGPSEDFTKAKNSLTADFVFHKKKIAVPSRKQKASEDFLTLKGATLNNLKKCTLKLPLGCFVAITGVSGSGKSSLFIDSLYPALKDLLLEKKEPKGLFTSLDPGSINKIIEVNQTPIGRTPRSNPATYIGVFDDIRKLFADLPESKSRGFSQGRFSFNVKEGSCPECHGIGMVKVDMEFLEPAWIECPQCLGERFDKETLSVRYKEKTIRDVLDMYIEDALEFFSSIPPIYKKLLLLHQVGLDYMKLGQSSTTISGGEAQRIKLAKELSKKATGNTLYILDEPSTGLHFYDLQNLLNVLHALVEKGNSVVFIEHNMDLVKTADYVIDMGPKSGEKGGKIIFEGTPEELAKKKTPTGKALYEVLHPPAIKKTKKKKEKEKTPPPIRIKGARQHNLQNIDINIPKNELTVISGPSGAGKSSLAFDTLFAEGQHRYTETLSPYIRQFVKQAAKPHVASIENLSPTIAIEQMAHTVNPRSTVGTMTEIYDYLRLLYARIGTPHCPKTGYEIKSISKERVVERVLELEKGEKIHILAPIEVRKKDQFKKLVDTYTKAGFLRVRLNKEIYNLNDEIPFHEKKRNDLFLVVDRLKVDPTEKMRLYEAISSAHSISRGKVTVMTESKDLHFNLSFAVEETGESYPEITSQTFSFNNPKGMCPHCQGLGTTWGLQQNSLDGDIIYFLWHGAFPRCEYLFDDVFYDTLSEEEFLSGSKKSFPTSFKGRKFSIRWKGVNTGLGDCLKQVPDEESLLPMSWRQNLKESHCPECKGSRLQPLSRHVTIKGLSIGELSSLPIDKAIDFIASIKNKTKGDQTLEHIHDEITQRLYFLDSIGLSYISLQRSAPSLSGGEAQRVRLSKQIKSGLQGLTYILDEPTSGLHPHDSTKLLSSIEELKKRKNTLLVVEHDPLFIKEADTLIEMGPGSGKNGGTILSKGKPKKLLQQSLPEKKKRAKKKFLTIENASHHNLKGLSLSIPLQNFTTLTGVSGSGKSTLLLDVIFKELRSLKGNEEITSVVMIDQKPLGQTSRSYIATYIDALSPLRTFFASLPEARMRGLQGKHFSSLHKRGMCKTCSGMGYKKIYLHFLPPVKMQCPDCKGLRLNKKSLEVRYQNKNLGEILLMNPDELMPLFQHHAKIRKKLEALQSVKLGYVPLGQDTQTLSSGESQRLKLAYYLSKRTRGHTLYLMDEPTTGLHKDEADTLIQLLHNLVDKKHSLIAIEHNLDFIAHSDHIIDLGPGAGEKGGSLVAEGSVEEIMQRKTSLTGQYLKKYFTNN